MLASATATAPARHTCSRLCITVQRRCGMRPSMSTSACARVCVCVHIYVHCDAGGSAESRRQLPSWRMR